MLVLSLNVDSYSLEKQPSALRISFKLHLFAYLCWAMVVQQMSEDICVSELVLSFHHMGLADFFFKLAIF